jgi:hypothetical protein
MNTGGLNTEGNQTSDNQLSASDSEERSDLQSSSSNVQPEGQPGDEPIEPERRFDLQLSGSNVQADGETERSTTKPEGEFCALEPWAEAVNGAELLDAVLGELRRFVVLGDWIGETFALWILHTHAYRLREVTTYMGIESPEKECGKSTLLTALSRMVDRPAVSANISSSAFFRAIEELQPTLLIDEADTNLRGKDDLTGILNAGYTKSTAFVWRMSYDVGTGEQEKLGKTDSVVPGRVARYSCWCPKAIAGIGRLPATLASRCIVVQMHRKTQRKMRAINPVGRGGAQTQMRAVRCRPPS